MDVGWVPDIFFLNKFHFYLENAFSSIQFSLLKDFKNA